MFLSWRSFSSFGKEFFCDFLIENFIAESMSYAFKVRLWCQFFSVVEGGEIAEGGN